MSILDMFIPLCFHAHEWTTKTQLDCTGGKDVEQAVVYSTLPQEYSTLTFRGEVVADGGGEEERSEVMYWHRGAYIIYYRNITYHSCIA